MNRWCGVTTALVWVLLAAGAAFCQQRGGDTVSIVVPAESAGAFVKRLLPYAMDRVEGFSGSFHIQSVEEIKIQADTVFFTAHMHGKNVEYTAKIGKHSATVVLGDANLHTRWSASFRYDKARKVLYLKPVLLNPEAADKGTQGEVLLTALFASLSNIEYPLEIKDIDPITTRFLGQGVTVDFELTDVYSADNAVVVEIRPIPRLSGKK